MNKSAEQIAIEVLLKIAQMPSNNVPTVPQNKPSNWATRGAMGGAALGTGVAAGSLYKTMGQIQKLQGITPPSSVGGVFKGLASMVGGKRRLIATLLGSAGLGGALGAGVGALGQAIRD